MTARGEPDVLDFANGLRDPQLPSGASESAKLRRVANGTRAIVPPQLNGLGLHPLVAWSGRREFILGYTAGVALGICHSLAITHLAPKAALAALTDITGAFANENPTVDEVVGYLERGRKAFLSGMAAGRDDGLAWETTKPAGGLLHAFSAGSPSPPKLSPAGALETATVAPVAASPARRVLRYLLGHMSQVVLVLLAVVVLVPIYQEWSRTRAAENAVREREVSVRAVARDAGNTASLLLGALRHCRVIGVPDLEACSTQGGALPREIAAKAMAGLALDYRARFDSSCAQVHKPQECLDLLSRAFRIARNAEELEK